GKRIGQEPVLAVSPSGLRVIAFRSDIALDANTPPGGYAYVATAPPGGSWTVTRLDLASFGFSTAFDAEGRPAVAYLARLDAADNVEVRISREIDGVWQEQSLGRTTYRQSANRANASRVGLAFDAQDRPWVAYADASTSSIKVVTPGGRPQRVMGLP